MVATLFVSEKCEACLAVVGFIRDHPILIPMIKPHDINRQGVPSGLKRVPALLQDNGEVLIGKEVLRWLENMIPVKFEGNAREVGAYIDEVYDGVGDSFALDSYGIQLAPPMTKDLENKISKDPKALFKEISSKPN
jgi:hypothetical protein